MTTPPPTAYTPPPERRSSAMLPAILIAASIAAFLVSFGLCGASARDPSRIGAWAVHLGLFLFFASILGFIIGILWLVIALIMDSRK